MKNNFTKYLLFGLLFACTIKAKSQIITTVESRCVSTGEAIFSGSIGSGGPYQLSAVAYPPQYAPTGIHFVPNLPDTFTALFPGTYTFKVIDQGGTVFNYPNVIITGDYVLPGNDDYIPSATSVTNCSTPNGTIQGIMTHGRPPYSYTISSGPAQVGVVNTTGTFTGLPAGDYLGQAEDSCQNQQTREVTVTGNAGFSITDAYINIADCNTFTLEFLTVSPSFPQAGHYEIINYNSSGGSVVRASGNSFPVNFTLFSRADVPDGRVEIKVYDTCGHAASYIPTGYSNATTDTILTGVINKIGCDSFSLDELDLEPVIPLNGTVQLTNAATGAVYNAPLPVHFTARESDIANGNIIIQVTDFCGDVISTNSIRALNNPWSFSADMQIHCSEVVLDSLHMIGFAAAPYVVKVNAVFIDSAGANVITTPDQFVTSFPYIVTGITGNPASLTVNIEVTDSCGLVRRVTLIRSFVVNTGNVVFSSCNTVGVKVVPFGEFTLPVTYSVSPDPGVGTNTDGNFELPDGTYLFSVTDSCGKKATSSSLIINRKWELLPLKKVKGCSPEFVTHEINAPAKSLGALTVRQYEGGMPVTGSSVLLNTQVFTNIANGCVYCSSTDTTLERMTFDSTLPGHTYTYIVTDICGRSDTVSTVNDPVQPFYHAAVSKTKCIHGSDVYAKWKSNGDASNSVVINVFDSSGHQLLGYNSGSTASTDMYPEGQILLYNVAPGMYTIQYSTIACSRVYIDTVFVTDYVQPQLNTVQNFTPCGAGGSPVIITASSGIPPYRYEIVNSYPGHYTLPSQQSSVFTLPVSQSTATVRVTDACGNSVTRTVAITKALPPFIRTNPSSLSTCTLPFAVRLFTDSVYAGSVFEWTKLTGIGAGTAVIGTGPSLPVVYNSIADTGTYMLRITVPGTCFDISATFSLASVLVTCAPGLAGNVFDDANGLTDGIVNGIGTNAGGLNAVLINEVNAVVAVTPVASNGAYNFADITAGFYSVMITAAPAVIGAAPPAVVLPSGWVNTGEEAGALTGNDGTPDGKLVNILLVTAVISELNFGIDHLPVANDTVQSRVNPGGALQVSVPVLTGSDLEDAIYDGVSGINTVIIQSLPLNATLYYNGSAVSTGQVITNYNPGLLTIDPLDNISSAQFTFSEMDAAMQVSLPDTVIILFFGLPVTITSFNATAEGSNVQLNWTVEEQINILNYTVEYSTDGYNFTTIGTVPATNISFYNLLHTTPSNGLNYYRLKIVENDGTISYSRVATIRFNKPSSVISVKPNPFKNSVDIVVELEKASSVKIILYDAAGRKVYQNVFTGIIGSNKFTINNLSRLAKGFYIMDLSTDDFIFQKRILKE